MLADGGVHADHSWKTPSWAVRIRRENGKIAGAGVLLSPDRVLTCAHVVPERARFTAEFVGAPGLDVPVVTAWVDDGAYVPETRDADGDPSGDVALLRLERPRPYEEAVALRRLSAPNRTVRMYGFPYEHNGGIWFRATIIGGCGRDGQVQLGPQTPGELASRGCSGAGVVDDLTGEVIGMVLSGLRDRHGNLFSFMSPAETIVRHLPQVARWTRGRAAVDHRLRSSGEVVEEVLDRRFAERLARWLRGDGEQVKISVVPADDTARGATLRRAITLADRELRTEASVHRASLDAPGTVPSAGGHDLAVDADGLTAAQVGERILERMGLWQASAEPVAERIRAAGVTLTLVVVGVDQAVDPPALLDLLAALRAQGSRLLLVFRTADASYGRAWSELVIGPVRERRAALRERLAEITGPLEAEVCEGLRAVRPDDEARVAESVATALFRVHAALAGLDATQEVAGLGQGPDLAAYERLAGRERARLVRTAERLDALRRRRDELLGLLRGYHAAHQQATGGRENLPVEALYVRACRLLEARPCDVRAAETAVEAYRRAVDEGERKGAGGVPAV